MSCRGGNKEVLALGGKKTNEKNRVHTVNLQQERTLHLFSINSAFFLLFSSLSLLFREEQNSREERSSLSLRPECLAVFKWRARTCFCLPRQIHCGGRWANTHTHILSQDTDLCVLVFVSVQAGNQVISSRVSGRKESLWQPT